jgi:hypothetical protein
VSPLDSAVLPAVAREHAWSALWQRLLQPVPDDSPAAEPGDDDPESDDTEPDEERSSEAA